MTITHIAKLKNRPYSGVDVVVPMHIISQQKHADVCLYNLCDAALEGIENFYQKSKVDFHDLPSPYNRPDLVVFHEAYNFENIKIYKYLLKKGIPYLIVPHGELSKEAQRKKWLKKKVANILLFNRFIQNAVAIQVLSQRELEATEFNVTKFIGTNGITLPECAKQSFHTDEIKFVFIGRLNAYHKGLDLLLQAIELKKEELTKVNSSFHIYGPDLYGHAEQLKTLILSKRLEDLVQLHGPVSGKEKQNVLLNADVFIQTSRFEGMPMGILEALSYGLPCMVSEGTTLKDIIVKHNAGWGVDTNAESIAIGLQQIVDFSGDKTIISNNARALAADKFSWDIIANETLSTYKKLIEKEK